MIEKTKDEIGGVAIEECVQIYSFLIDNSEYTKAKSVNKDVVAA